MKQSINTVLCIAACLLITNVAHAELTLDDFAAKTFESRGGGQLLYRQLDVKDPKAGKKYPLLIYFHGWGSRDNDNTGVSNGGVGTWEALRRRPRFVAAAAPICGIGHVPSAKTCAKVPLGGFHGDQWSVDDSRRFSQRRLRDGAA